MIRWNTYPAGKLQTLLESKRPIFVLNTSSLPSGEKGTVIVNFYDGRRKEYFKMPPTFIPMAISHIISPKQLEDSRDFKECLQRGMLTLVDPDQAEEYLDTTEAREEHENLVLSEHSMKSKSLKIDGDVEKRTQVSHTDNEMHGPQQELSKVDTVSNKVRGLVESMISETITAQECLRSLKRHQTALNPTDLSYVIQNSSDNDLTSWAREALNKSAKGDTKQELVENKQPVSSKSKGKNNSFDFDADADAEMTPEQKIEDAEARAKAEANQALRGESKVNTEIDKMLGR